LKNDNYSGLIAKSIKYLWDSISRREEKYFIKVSYIEIYNEQINDLLNTKAVNLQMRGTKNNSFFVEGATVIECKNPNELVEILVEGTKNRKVGSHEMNKDSSRSHSIFSIYVISESNSPGGLVKKFGKVSLVDLAGSERLKDSKSEGIMIKETGNINKSLHVLGKVISILTEKKDPKKISTEKFNKKLHIPYRDSKLTMLLADSLGGNSRAMIIACISPSGQFSEETLSTINYATRAMNIVNVPIIQVI
jgi:kinesin family protein 12